jgi:hypothetical protein
MRHLLLSLSLLSLVSLLSLGLGCKPSGASSEPNEGSANGKSGAAHGSGIAGPPIHFASAGVPHSGVISLVALDPTGVAALTRDNVGGVRLWSALDGSREPWVVPVRDPRAMTLAAHERGWTLALIDGAGGARVVGVDPVGAMQPLASLPPTDPLRALLVLPGGERLLAVGEDHVIRLLGRDGRELARLDLPGRRPASLRISVPRGEGGEAVVVAVTAGEFDAKASRFAVELLPLALGEASLALAGPGQRIHLDAPPTYDNPSLAPDGRAAVYLQRKWQGGAAWVVHAIQLDDGLERSVDSGLSTGVQPRLGLLAGARVLLDDGTGLGRVVDLREREVELIALRSSPTVSHLESVFAGSIRAAPSGTWLAVHELDSDSLRYLGYDVIHVNDVGLSPSGATVAWALGDRIAVEAVGPNHERAGEVFEVPGTGPVGSRFVEFVDEEQLLVLDWSGGAELLRWRDGEVVAAVDLASHPQSAELVRNGHGDALLLVRSQLWQNPSVVEIRAGEFGRRVLTHGAANFAGLTVPSGAAIDDWSAWTLDAAGGLRSFTLAELAGGVSIKAAAAAGEPLAFGIPEQLGIDNLGHQYWVRTEQGQITLHASGQGRDAATALAPGHVIRISPSPDGGRIAIVQQRDAQQLLTVFDAETLQPQWAQPLPSTNGLAWSDAGERLAIPATFGGGVVFDARDGSPIAARCGLAFEVRSSPPQNFGFGVIPSVCEL